MRKRRLLIGPGVILALVAAYFVWRGAPERMVAPRPALPPGRAVLPERPRRAAPDVNFLLEQRRALRLDEGQVKALTALRERHERETAALREALEGAAGRFRGGMQERGEGGETLQGVRERSAEVSQLSRELVAARRAAWEEAVGRLTSDQREWAEELWHARMGGGSP